MGGGTLEENTEVIEIERVEIQNRKDESRAEIDRVTKVEGGDRGPRGIGIKDKRR